MQALHGQGRGHIVLVHEGDQRFRGDGVVGAARRQSRLHCQRRIVIPVIGNQMGMGVEQGKFHRLGVS